ADYFCWPECTTVLCCSTTRERLEDRIWSEVKKFHKLAKQRFPWLPGTVIEGRLRIVTDEKQEDLGRDVRNGWIGIPVKRGESTVGIGDFAGFKNKRVRLIGDELSLLEQVFIDALSNLSKNKNFKVIGLGNPKDISDPLGQLAEPAPELGGWASGIDLTPGTKTWRTKWPNGIAIQFYGPDSPNYDGKLGVPLITAEQIARDERIYGRDSIWFSMMNLGQFPRGQMAKQVLTRELCVQNNATAQPRWADNNRVKLAALDPAFASPGGSRCILVFGELGTEIPDPNQPGSTHKQVLAVTEIINVPLSLASPEPVEHQIAKFVNEQLRMRAVPPHNFFYDSSMRTALTVALHKFCSEEVVPVDLNGPPSQDYVSDTIRIPCKDYYFKFVSELWYNVRLVVESGQLRGLTEEAVTEFCAREWTYTGTNKIEVEPKENVRRKLGRSPDLADAISILVYAARQRGLNISGLRNPYESKRLDHELKKFQAWEDEYWNLGAIAAV
ncbi:MAG: hypothetical protein NZ739_10335, partial [Verrucomicrobiae bacterium]|nr:hypothetical protein [Verrucomicrobiae bacterium]